MSALTKSIPICPTTLQSRAATGVTVFVIARPTGFFHAMIGLIYEDKYFVDVLYIMRNKYSVKQNQEAREQETHINLWSRFWGGLWSRLFCGPLSIRGHNRLRGWPRGWSASRNVRANTLKYSPAIHTSLILNFHWYTIAMAKFIAIKYSTSGPTVV